MAFTITQRSSVNSGTTSAGSRTTAAFTPTANSRLFVFAAAQRDNHTAARNWTISDTLTSSWTKLDESTLYIWEVYAQYSTNVVAWYTDIGGSPASMTVTVDASTSSEFYAVIAFDVTGYDTGTPFAQASVDNGAAVNPASNSASGTLTLGSAPTSGNLVVAMFGAGADAGGGFATPTGYTALTNQSQAYCQAAVFYKTDTTTAAVTCSDLGQTVGAWGGVIFEMTLAAAGGTDALTASDLTAGTPTLDTPAIGQIHALTGGDLASGTPTLTAAALGQIHALTADDLATAAPTLSTPTLGASHVLTADNLTAGTPALDTPALGQVHAINADGLTSGTPALDAATLGQVHALTGDGLTAGTPTLDTPTLSAEGIDALTADDLATQAPALDSPALGQVHALTADDLSVGAVTLDAPTLGQVHGLTADDVTTGAPVLDTPALVMVTAVIAAYGTVTSPAAVGTVDGPLSASWDYLLTETGAVLLTEAGEILETESSSAARAGAVTMPAPVGAVITQETL